MLREQFGENVRDVHLLWELKRRVEANADTNFLALRKIAMLWAEEVEAAVQHRAARSHAVEATVERVEAGVERVEAGVGRAEAGAHGEVRAQRWESAGDLGQLWTELASQRRLLTEGMAEHGRVLKEVLAQQQQLLEPRPTSSPVPPRFALR